MSAHAAVKCGEKVSMLASARKRGRHVVCASAVPDALRSQCRFDVGAMIVCVPGRDLRQTPDSAVPGCQAVLAEARDQQADGHPAAAQVLRRLGLAHRRSVPGVLRVEGVHGITVHLNPLACDDLAYPARQVLIRVRHVIHHHCHRPGIPVQGRGAPLLVAAATDEGDHPLPGRVNVRCICRWAPRILCHESHPTNRHELKVKPGTGPIGRN